MNFEKELTYAKAVMPDSKKAVYNARKNMKIIENYIEHLKQYFDVKEDDFQKIINEYMDNILQDYVLLGSTKLLQKQSLAFNYLVNNPAKLMELYRKTKDKDFSEFDLSKEKSRYYGNHDECIKLAIEESIHTLRESKSKIPEPIIERVKKIISEKDPEKKKKYKQVIMQNPELKDSFEYISSILGKNEEDELLNHMSFRVNEIQNKLDSIKRGEIKISGEFLKEFGFLEEALNKQNKDYQLLGIPEMQYELIGENEEIGLEDIFKEEFLQTLTSEQLTILNTFWQNRFTKNVEQILEGLFIYDNIGYWDKIKKGETLEPIEDETILNILYKKQICKRLYNNLSQNSETNYEGNIVYSFIDLGVISPSFKKEYHNYFRNQISKSKNDIIVDLKAQDVLRNQISLIYEEKDDMLSETLLEIEHSKIIKNWGYIPENSNGKNSIENGNKFILIGIDYPGFNMPLRLHVQREKMLEFMKNIKGKTIIPIYKGSEDMTRIDGDNITTKIFMPLTPKTESALIKKNKTIKPNDKNYKFFTHVGTLVTKKVKSIKPIMPTEYIDIETGKEQGGQEHSER